MDILIIVEGSQKGQRYPVESERLSLGRDRQNDVPLDDTGASRVHAYIVRTAEGLRLRDNKSTNGTLLNSRRITDAPIEHGDRIAIGDTVILVECTPEEKPPSVLVSDAEHDTRKDITVEMNSTVLLQAVQAAEQRNPRAQEQYLKLFNFMTRITGVLVMDQLLPLALAEMARNLCADRGAILFLNKADDLTPKAIWPKNSDDVVVSRTITEHVLKTRQGLLSNPGKGNAKLRDTVAISTRDVGSVLCVPLMAEDHVLGVVYLDTRLTSRPFTENDLRLLSCMAMQMAITIQNAHLYRSLRNAEDFSALILKSMSSGLLVVDSRDVVLRANDTACRILDIEQKELVGLPIKGTPKFREIAMMIEQTRQTSIPMDRNEVLADIGTRQVPLGVSTSLLEDFGGHAIGVVCMFRDLTRLKRLAEEVKRSQRLASLGEMAAGIAHEVRNPLNSVHGFSQLLLEAAERRKEPEDIEYASIIMEEVDRINRIVQDLLDFSRQQELTMSALDLRELLSSLVRQLMIEATPLGVALEFEPDASIHPVVLGNTDKLLQMFMNILRNAVQACSKDGAVTVTVEVGEDPNKIYPEAIVTIRDNGCGIPVEQMDKIFNPFFTTKDIGTGLGLSICQKIVEQHAGHIHVESNPGLGSVFTIRLPMRHT